MNITSLRTFLAIVEAGSLVRASQELHVTQSTVTARLKTLEEALGQVLLNRQKSGITLTPAGTKLLRYARIMTGLWRQAELEAGLPAGLNAVCTFGCDPELWSGPGRAFFDGVLSGRPDIAMSVLHGRGRELEEWLNAGQVDVIMTYGAVARGAQTIHALPPEELALFANRPETPIDTNPGYVYVDHGEEFRRHHAETWHYAGVARVSFNSAGWALRHLLEHGGSAYLPRGLAAPQVARGRLFELTDAPVTSRKRNLIVNDTAAANWDWFATLADRLARPA